MRLKHDIVLLGRLGDGLGYYRFVYNGGHTAYVGVMAQEVEAVMPEAVSFGRDGYMRVSYDVLGLPFETYAHWLADGAHLPSVETGRAFLGISASGYAAAILGQAGNGGSFPDWRKRPQT